jgi:hypothetical protein
MESRTSATEEADYMKLQELGGVHRPKKRNTLAIPEDSARGGNFAQPVSEKLLHEQSSEEPYDER